MSKKFVYQVVDTDGGFSEVHKMAETIMHIRGISKSEAAKEAMTRWVQAEAGKVRPQIEEKRELLDKILASTEKE
jgi:hypothetical protein